MGVFDQLITPTYLFQEGDVLFITLDHTTKGSWLGVRSEDRWSSRIGSVLEVQDDDIHLSLNVFRDFKDLYRAKDHWENVISRMEGELQRETIEMVCQELILLNHFDHSGLVSDVNVNNGMEPVSELKIDGPGMEIDPDMRRILKAISADPGRSLVTLAEELVMNRQTLSRFRKYAYEEKLLTPAVFIDPKKLNLSIMGVFILHFEEDSMHDLKELMSEINSRIGDFCILNMVSLNIQVLLTYHRDFRSFKNDVRRAVGPYVEGKILSRPPVIVPISMDIAKPEWFTDSSN